MYASQTLYISFNSFVNLFLYVFNYSLVHTIYKHFHSMFDHLAIFSYTDVLLRNNMSTKL